MAIRFKLELGNTLYFPVAELLEFMPEIFPKSHFEVVEDDELPCGVHAETDVENHVIYVKQSVYDGACSGNGRDRMTIAHEIGHYLLLYFWGFKFQRNFAGSTIPTC
jgi:hypothetical protein